MNTTTKIIFAGHHIKPSFAHTIFALILREITTTYSRAFGGYLWAILEPVAGIVLLAYLFSLSFQRPPIGNNFALFYAVGYLPFTAFLDISTKVQGAMQFSKPLLQFSAVSFLDTILARWILNLVTQFTVFLIVITSIIFYYRIGANLDFGAVACAFLMAVCLGLGIGTLNAFLGMVLPIWQQIWRVAMRPLFIVSCVLFLFETVPQPFRDVLWYNPIVHVIGMMRHGFYPTYSANFVSPAYVFAIAGVTFLLGLILLRKYHRHFLDE
jgi:capsular polysaccharide transport system permease protein